MSWPDPRTPLVSVAIPTRNRADLLEPCLESLVAQTLPRRDFEVVVVDDGSTDGTRGVCKRFSNDLPLSYQRLRPSGIAAAKNAGLFASTGWVVLFFDDDDVAHTDLLRAHVEAHRRWSEQRLAILGYTTWHPRLDVTPLMRYVTDIGQFLFSYPSLEAGRELDFTHFWGGRASAKRSFLLEHGAFNQDFTFGYEDVELGFRLSKHGFAVVYYPEAVSFMVRTVTLRDFSNRCERQGRSLVRLASLSTDEVIRNYCQLDELLALWNADGQAFPRLVADAEHLVASAPEMEDQYAIARLHSAFQQVFRLAIAKGVAYAGHESARPKKSRRSMTPEQTDMGMAAPPAEHRREAATTRSPVVLLGAPRSGTTYLVQVLNQSSEIFISNESRVFYWLNAALSVLPNDDQYLLAYRNEFIPFAKQHLPQMIEGFYRRLSAKPIWGDKYPHYAANTGVLRTIADLFPQAVFVNIIRDGRDVVTSLLGRHDANGKPWADFQSAHAMWLKHVTTARGFLESLDSSRQHEVRYEELVADDGRVVRKVCDFLGVAFEPGMEAFCTAQQRARTPFSDPTRDLREGAAESRWSEALPAAKRAESLRLLRAELVALGYETSSSADAALKELASI